MHKFKIQELLSFQGPEYKHFLHRGLLEDEENFRITPEDDKHSSFPTGDKEDSFTLGAYVEATLAGVVSFMRDGADRQKLRHKGILFRMYVSMDFRGQGIGKKLIAALLERVKAIGDIEQVNLTVASDNKPAKAMYEKFGFETFGSEKNAIRWKGKYFTEEQMVLRMSGKAIDSNTYSRFANKLEDNEGMSSIRRLQYLCDTLPPLLSNINEENFCCKPAPDKWSKKEILGHLIDSATNNHQRFVRSQFEENPIIQYDQVHWNTIHNYNNHESRQLIRFWEAYNRQLIELISKMTKSGMMRVCNTGKESHTVRWLFDDYVQHQEHHLRQIVDYK